MLVQSTLWSLPATSFQVHRLWSFQFHSIPHNLSSWYGISVVELQNKHQFVLQSDVKLRRFILLTVASRDLSRAD